MVTITKFITKFFPDIPKELIGKIISLGSFKKYQKGKVLVEAGRMPKYYFFIKSGITRGYFINEKGKIYTKSISGGGEIAGPLSALIKGKPSNTIYECLTESEIYSFNYQDFLKLATKHHELAIFHSKVLSAMFLDLERRAISLSLLSATERYKNFKNRFPNIENLIPQYQIASYLSITNVQLSRIRRKLAGY